MTLYLGFQSALSYWRSAKGFQSAKASYSMPSKVMRTYSQDIDSAPLYQLGIRNHPIHVMTGVDKPMGNTSTAVFHRETKLTDGPIRTPWYYHTFGDVFIASPELCFLHLARSYSFHELLHLGFELCGTYSLSPGGRNGISSCSQLTTPQKLQSFLETASGHPGKRKAQSAAQLLLENAASPRETDLALMLCAPVRHGGYGLPAAELNAELPTREMQRVLMDRSGYKPDFLWRKERVIVEYDSDAEHSSPAKITRDASRRNSLLALGYETITISNATMKDLAAMDRMARILSRKLHRRARWDTIDGLGKRSVWHQHVLSRQNQYWDDAEGETFF